MKYRCEMTPVPKSLLLRRRGNRARAFSLIEMMVAMTILSVLLLLMTQVLDQVQRSWTFSENRIGQYREARVAFDVMTKNISQASMNTYWDLIYDEDEGNALGYDKASELHFVTMPAEDIGGDSSFQPVGHSVFFQAPLGFTTVYRNLNNIYNGRGYFVAFGSDERFKPSFVKSQDRYRFRLFEFRPPAEKNGVFEDGQEEREGDRKQEFTKWFKQAVTLRGPRSEIGNSFEDQLNPLAENIVTMAIAPLDPDDDASDWREGGAYSRIAGDYQFDSNKTSLEYSQQVPPLLRITIVAIDETSAVRVEDGTSMPQLVPDQLFTNSKNYDGDVEALEREFQNRGIGYRVFSTLVMLRSSKWSTGTF